MTVNLGEFDSFWDTHDLPPGDYRLSMVVSSGHGDLTYEAAGPSRILDLPNPGFVQWDMQVTGRDVVIYWTPR